MLKEIPSTYIRNSDQTRFSPEGTGHPDMREFTMSHAIRDPV